MNKVSSEHIFNRWVILTLLLGMVMTGLFSYQTKYNNEKRIIQAVSKASNKVLEEVTSRVKTYQYGLRGARGVVLTAGEYAISKDIFHQYSLTRDLETEFPGSRGFGFIRRVPQSQVDYILPGIQQRDWPDFKITTFSSNFSDRYLVQFFEPLKVDSSVIGLDIASEKNRREAADASLYSGEVRITGPLTFSQGVGSKQQSILILMPIYRGGKVPSTLAERVKAGFGWSFSALLMEEVLSGLDIDTEKVHYELYDITDLDEKERFYNSGDLYDRQYEYIQSTYLYGRHWESRLSVTTRFIMDLQLFNPNVVLLIGIFISVLGAVVVSMIWVNVARKREVITYQSRISAVVESSADGIISKGLDGIILSWNKGAERILGYTQEETIGKHAMDLLVPKDLQYENKLILSSVRDKKEACSIETLRQTKSGKKVPVALTLSPIFDPHNLVVGISISLRDVSERKRAEEKIQDLNASLENQVKARTLELEQLNLLLNDVLKASSEISIVATDINGVIRLFNSGAERMLGYSAEEVIGELTPIAFHMEEEIRLRRVSIEQDTGFYASDPMDVLLFHARNNDYDSQEWTYTDKDKNTRPVSLVITPMKNNADETVGFLCMAMDITEQKTSQKALESTSDQLLIATRAARLGVWRWHLDTDVLEWNDIMFDIYQYPLSLKDEGMTIGHWRNRLHPDDRDQTVTFLQTMVDNNESYSDVFRVLLPDDSIRYIKAEAYIEQDSHGQTIRVTGVNQDITSERTLETWLRKAKSEADAASAAKSSFLANMSHEIRTPMNAVLGMLHLAKRTELTYQQDDYISKAQISAKSLLGLINDILDFSKVDAGKLTLENVPFEVESLLYELSTVLSGSSLSNNVELIFDIDKDIPALLVGDKLRLLQVLINLVSNAVKFTLEGSVILEIKQGSALSSGISRLTVSVKDTGIGISKDHLKSIFEVFSQAESSIARRFGGSGLGLVISRRFVALMGGELSIESTLNEGSRFFFTIDLPVAEAQTKDITPMRSLRKPVKILIVESNLTSQGILGRMALNLGWSYEKAESLQQVSNIVREGDLQGHSFDIVLLDMKTADFDGHKSIKKIQAEFDSSTPPKVILLANATSDKIEDALGSISDYLLKPLTLSRLSETVYKALSSDKSLLDKKSAISNDELRLSGIKLLLVEDNAFNQQIATELLVIEGAVVTVAGGGLDGVNTVVGNEKDAFDLVLMDMQMPGMDGLEATKRIRQHARFDSLPIIAMTANVSEADRQLCFQAGMNDHIGKPLDIDQMIDCILKYTCPETMPMSDLNHIEESTVNTSDSHFEECEGIQSILDRFGGSTDLFRSVSDGFLVESKDLLNAIAEGVEIRDKVKVHENIHTLKGVSLTMGLLHFSHQLDLIEHLLKTSDNDQEIETCLSTIHISTLDGLIQRGLANIFEELDNLNE